MENSAFVGGGGPEYAEPQYLKLKYANRHGLIAGATGTGKTVTLQILAEEFSTQGIPVFLSDVKGDLSGIAHSGNASFKLHDAFMDRVTKIGLSDFDYSAFPVTFWDLFGEQGHPVRTTVAEMGPLLLSRLLELTEPQEGILNIAFRVSDEQGLALLDLKDLQALLVWLGENREDLSLRYGNISVHSIGAIQRRLLVLENQGANDLFGEPALELSDLLSVDADGRGRINILAADKLMASPRLYATFLLWLLSELFETLPEIGDPDKPKLVFFFDEAHLLFDDAPKALMDKVEQVARLIRSKGVGIYFVTQSPTDIPDDVLGQIGNRVQHALRAYTAKDRRALRLASETYRDNPRFSTEDAILQVGVGEALTSFLEEKGIPGVVERTLIRPPQSQLGPISKEARSKVVLNSPYYSKYTNRLDRVSAYEILAERAKQAADEGAQKEAELEALSDASPEVREFSSARRYSGSRVGRSSSKRLTRKEDSIGSALGEALIKELKGTTGRRIIRGVLGGFFKGR